MAKNLTHLFVDGRRATLDRRDDSVVLSNDDDGAVFDGLVFNGARIGHLTAAANGYDLVAVNGQRSFARRRADGVRWLWRTAAGHGVTTVVPPLYERRPLDPPEVKR